MAAPHSRRDDAAAAIWLDAFFNFVKDDLGIAKIHPLPDGGLEIVLDASGNIFYGKRRWPNLGRSRGPPSPALLASLGIILVAGAWQCLAAGRSFGRR